MEKFDNFAYLYTLLYPYTKKADPYNALYPESININEDSRIKPIADEFYNRYYKTLRKEYIQTRVYTVSDDEKKAWLKVFLKYSEAKMARSKTKFLSFLCQMNMNSLRQDFASYLPFDKVDDLENFVREQYGSPKFEDCLFLLVAYFFGRNASEVEEMNLRVFYFKYHNWLQGVSYEDCRTDLSIAITKVDMYFETDSRLIELFLRALSKPKFDVQGEVLEIPWTFVSFFDGYYLIHHPKYQGTAADYPLRVPNSKCRQAFKAIKNVFLSRMTPIKVLCKNGRLMKLLEDDHLDSCITLMEHKVSEPQIVVKEPSLLDLKPLNGNRRLILNKVETKKVIAGFKSKFLNYLCNMQLENYRVVCCVENRVNSNMITTSEYAFIFTINVSMNYITVVYENERQARCSYAFRIRKQSYQEGIDAIYDYFSSNEVNKRQSMARNEIEIRSHAFYDYARFLHNDYAVWASKLRMY